MTVLYPQDGSIDKVKAYSGLAEAIAPEFQPSVLSASCHLAGLKLYCNEVSRPYVDESGGFDDGAFDYCC